MTVPIALQMHAEPTGRSQAGLVWARFFLTVDGRPFPDSQWTDNVVVMLADYGTNVFDGNPDAQVLGSNPVLVFTDGKVQQGVWLRFESTDPFSLFDNIEDLNELHLQPGRTWLEIPRNVDGTVEWE